MTFESKKEKQFLLLTCMLSLIQGILYLVDGFLTGFTLNNYIMLGMDLLYIPAVLILRSRGLEIYIILMSIALLFSTSFTPTNLYNNFSALLCLFMGIMIFPKHKKYFMLGYIIASAIMFALNDERMYLYLIHISRASWLFTMEDMIIFARYNRKPIILTSEEQRIIAQLCENKLHKQIELDGASESTIRRRLAQAKKRNGIQSDEELKELYKKHYSQTN